MSGDTARQPAAAAFRDLFSDLSTLVQSELRLVRAEMMEKVSGRLHALIWFGAAGLLGLLAVLLVIQSIVYGIASLGLALHWAYLLVALVLAAVAAGAFFYARSLSRGSLEPKRSIRQLDETVRTIREQMT